MADYKVGNLQIALQAVNETASDFDKLKKSLQAIRNLIGNIANADIGRFSTNIKKITDNLSPFLSEVKSASAELNELGIAIKELGIYKTSKVATEFRNISQAVEESTNKTKEFNEEVGSGTPQLSGATTEVKRLSRELNSNSNATKKGASGWKKFIKSIGRIAMYRAIRRVIQLITQSITESIQEFAKLDDNVNNIVSSATSSLKVIQLSFGATLLPILQAITPILNQIAVGFANVANVISSSMATGETFWAINAKAIKDYREQLNKTTGTLASFDKIQSLNQKDEFSFFEEKKVEDFNKELGVSKINLQSIQFMLQGIGSLFSGILKLIYAIASSSAVQTIIGVIGWVIGALAEVVAKIINVLDKSGLLEPILWGILAVLVYIGATKAITWLSNTQFITWINKLAVALKTNLSGALKTVTTDLVGLLGTTQALVFSIGALVGALAYFISNAGQLSTTAKVLIPLISVLTGAFAALAVAKAAAAAGIAAPVKALITAGALVAAITMVAGTAIAKKINSGSSSSSNASIPKFADGGSVPYGTLFYAGEAGAETVTVGSSGRTEVTNVSQMETALYNALVRYGRENRGSDSAINVNIDGQKVFEAVQRTANKKGLGFSRV